ncbi:MAG: AAA family ATPase [Euryarchaeota archaeon]|nr:AAA family ATPase [Euryarchaeota archaeon]
MLIIFCGIPGAGKSEIAYSAAKKLELQHKMPALVVGTDNIREMIPADTEKFNPIHEPFIRNTMKELIKLALKAGYVAICDDTNYYTTMRRDLIRIAQKLRVPYKIVFIQCSTEIALKRNKQRGEPIPPEVISDISRKFDIPGKYRWDRPNLIIDSGSTDPGKAGTLIASAFVELFKREKGEKVCEIKKRKLRPKITRAEKIDVMTRRVMSELMKKYKSKELGQKLSKLRREIIQTALSKTMKIEQAKTLFVGKAKKLLKEHHKVF